jgi:hypothetical protein
MPDGTTLHDAQPATADQPVAEPDGQAIPVFAFVGRVLAGFVTLVVLMVFVLAMVALAYWSKHDLPAPQSPPSATTPAAAPRS